MSRLFEDDGLAFPMSPGHHWDPQLTGLARCLARAVARGLLSEQTADVALLVRCLHAHRLGSARGDPFQVAEIAQHVMRLHADNIVAKREIAVGSICRTLRPLLATRVPARRIRAEAHNCNADAGFPLTETEVDEVAGIQVWIALHPEGVASNG